MRKHRRRRLSTGLDYVMMFRPRLTVAVCPTLAVRERSVIVSRNTQSLLTRSGVSVIAI
jgi:hypothetical protein